MHFFLCRVHELATDATRVCALAPAIATETHAGTNKTTTPGLGAVSCSWQTAHLDTNRSIIHKAIQYKRANRGSYLLSYAPLSTAPADPSPNNNTASTQVPRLVPTRAQRRPGPRHRFQHEHNDDQDLDTGSPPSLPPFRMQLMGWGDEPRRGRVTPTPEVRV